MAAEKDNSLSKQEAIEQLRQTIRQLETIIQQLDETSIIDLPSSTAIQNLITTTTQLEKIVPEKTAEETAQETNLIENTKIESQKNSIANSEQISSETEEKAAEFTSTRVEDQKQEISPKPIDKNQESPRTSNNSKWIIIGVIAIVIILIPLSWKLFISDRTPQLIAQDTATTIVQSETESETTDNPDTTPEETALAADNQINEVIPKSQDSISETETISTTEVPSELVTENKSQKVAVETIKPNIKFTPEQNLIAALENKTQNFAARYNEDLVISIEPNFDESIVTVTLTNEWYKLIANRQDRLAEEMLKKSRQLEFAKLRITDSQNNLIARSPVVGKDMVIFRRTI